MKFATSYFYQIRHFSSNMIPISTAMYPPKWYGNGFWRDSRNVINGLSCKELAPGPLCEGLCHGDCVPMDSDNCSFLDYYAQQLNTVEFSPIYDRAIKVAKFAGISIDDAIIVFMVYEAPNNPCSERCAIQNWVRSNGYECNELTFK